MASPLDGPPTIGADVARVEQRLRAVVASDDAFMTEVASHLIVAGGKRERPAFCMAAASLSDEGTHPASDAAVDGGVAVELVHVGSLIHDDVMDEAATRRTAPSVNARWGNLRAILAGDYLLARASEIASGISTEVAGLLAATIARLCEGQVSELQTIYDVERTEDAYFQAIAGKTSALFSTACRIGGLIGGLAVDDTDRVTEFGRLYGMAFQVVDDVLDVVATEEQLGKPAGLDLVDGVYTLPVIRSLASTTGTNLRALLGARIEGDTLVSARDLVRSNGAIPSAVDTARQFTAEAKAALSPFGGHRAASALADAADRLIGRVEALT